ncbi:MAG: hypothetical protein R3C19_01925 [Planctomycetaceae bacterium]
MTSLTAAGWYLSLLMHCVAYAAVASVFWLLSADLLRDHFDASVPIRASLDDVTIDGEAPRFEVVPDLSTGMEQQESNVQQVASHLKAVENGLVDTVSTDALVSFAGNESDAGNGLFFQVPESGLAVTKGSFTAWTEPERPAALEKYLIIIEIRLPSDVRQYRLSDLRGSSVRGTDGYEQSLPYHRNTVSSVVGDDGRERITGESQRVSVSGGKVQLVIEVPGAKRLVRDTITLRSRRLRESQELELVFGTRSKDSE